jgi:hypothetical protein
VGLVVVFDADPIFTVDDGARQARHPQIDANLPAMVGLMPKMEMKKLQTRPGFTVKVDLGIEPGIRFVAKRMCQEGMGADERVCHLRNCCRRTVGGNGTICRWIHLHYTRAEPPFADADVPGKLVETPAMLVGRKQLTSIGRYGAQDFERDGAFSIPYLQGGFNLQTHAASDVPIYVANETSLDRIQANRGLRAEAS